MSGLNLNFTICFLCFYFLRPCLSQTVLYDLYDHLLDTYKPYIRPRVDPHVPVNVSVQFTVTSVQNIEENTQTLVSSGYYNFTWKDDILLWDPDTYSGIMTITLPLNKIWSPDISIFNSLEDISLISPHNDMARVSHLGVVNWFLGMTQRTKCAIDMTKFPFDMQTCSIRILQWASVISEVNLFGTDMFHDPVLYQGNGEWEIIGTSMKTLIHSYDDFVTQAEVYFTVTVQRKHLYYVIMNILPIMLLSVLNLGVFLLPPESGEKVSLCISIVLSYAVFLTVISATLPEVSDTVSIFGIYLLTMMFLKVMTTLATIVILKRYHSSTNKGSDLKESAESSKIKITTQQDQGRIQASNLNHICFCICLVFTVLITTVCFGLMLS